MSLLKQLEKVLNEPIGLAFRCEDADKLRANFYLMRRGLREAGDTRFDDLSFSISPHHPNILFVYKKNWQEADNDE